MGLDMYLYAKRYVSQYDIGTAAAEFEAAEAAATALAMPRAVGAFKSVEISTTAIYWRKANAIHKWFVDTVQDGDDDCRNYCVSDEQLADLRNLCLEAIKTKDAALLPPVAGFFFGGTEAGEHYWEELERTAVEIEALLKLPNAGDLSFEYQSSW